MAVLNNSSINYIYNTIQFNDKIYIYTGSEVELGEEVENIELIDSFTLDYYTDKVDIVNQLYEITLYNKNIPLYYSYTEIKDL